MTHVEFTSYSLGLTRRLHLRAPPTAAGHGHCRTKARTIICTPRTARSLPSIISCPAWTPGLSRRLLRISEEPSALCREAESIDHSQGSLGSSGVIRKELPLSHGSQERKVHSSCHCRGCRSIWHCIAKSSRSATTNAT